MTTGPDIEGVKDYLRRYIKMAVPHNLSGNGYITSSMGSAATPADMLDEQPKIEQVLARFYPDWRTKTAASTRYRWNREYEAARHCLSLLEHQDEIDRMLGSTAPRLAADGLHPWVWDAARPQWESGNHAEAVRAAATNVNSRLQNKVGRKDLSDTKLIQEALSNEVAKPGRSRLRVVPKDDSEHYRSMQDGVRSFGAGCFLAIRNPVTHQPVSELDFNETQALERLAALSLLARWIEESVLEAVPDMS